MYLKFYWLFLYRFTFKTYNGLWSYCNRFLERTYQDISLSDFYLPDNKENGPYILTSLIWWRGITDFTRRSPYHIHNFVFIYVNDVQQVSSRRVVYIFPLTNLVQDKNKDNKVILVLMQQQSNWSFYAWREVTCLRQFLI